MMACLKVSIYYDDRNWKCDIYYAENISSIIINY